MAKAAPQNRFETGTHEPAQQRAIDLVHLAKQTLGDRNLEQEVLRMFADGTRAYSRRINEARTPEEVKIGLHSLKGAAAGVGANGVAAVARAAEQELRETGALSAEALSDVSFAVEEVNAYIDELLLD